MLADIRESENVSGAACGGRPQVKPRGGSELCHHDGTAAFLQVGEGSTSSPLPALSGFPY